MPNSTLNKTHCQSHFPYALLFHATIKSPYTATNKRSPTLKILIYFLNLDSLAIPPNLLSFLSDFRYPFCPMCHIVSLGKVLPHHLRVRLSKSKAFIIPLLVSSACSRILVASTQWIINKVLFTSS